MFQYRIPADDTHTLHLHYRVEVPKPGETAPHQDQVPYLEYSPYDEKGRLNNTLVRAQDEAAWIMQGSITDRTNEHPGVTDVGIIMFRKLWTFGKIAQTWTDVARPARMWQ